MLIILRRWFYCILIFFVMSVELRSPRWIGYLARSLSFIHRLYIHVHLRLLTLLVSWEASVSPESPEYFISAVFK